MEKLIIEVFEEEAYNELNRMEENKKIHITCPSEKSLELTVEERRKKLEALKGSLSHLNAEKLLKELDKMRNEWERDF